MLFLDFICPDKYHKYLNINYSFEDSLLWEKFVRNLNFLKIFFLEIVLFIYFV